MTEFFKILRIFRGGSAFEKAASTIKKDKISTINRFIFITILFITRYGTIHFLKIEKN
jgi:hypothetical protein